MFVYLLKNPFPLEILLIFSWDLEKKVFFRSKTVSVRKALFLSQ